MTQIDRDSYADWVLKCLGIYDDGMFLDKMEKDFEVSYEPTQEETIDDIQYALIANRKHPDLADYLATGIFDEIVQKAVEWFDADEEDFEIDFSNIVKPEVKCKCKIVTNWKQIEKLYEAKTTRKSQM